MCAQHPVTLQISITIIQLRDVVANTELWKTRGLHSKQTYVVNI